MALSIANITFDCQDAAKLAQFWAAALGRDVDEGAQQYFASIGHSTGHSNGADGPALLFAMVPEPKTAKNRMHVDLRSDDRDAEVARLVGLGATHVTDHDEWGVSWSVLADPEGNEFCVA